MKEQDLYINVGNLFVQDISKLDDLLTEIDGEPNGELGVYFLK